MCDDHSLPTVADGSAVRLRYFDHQGELRTAVILSTVPITEIRERAKEIKAAMDAYASALGGIVLDVSVDLEDRDQIVDMGLDGARPVRGAGFLQLATSHGRGVDLIIADQDDTWNPTSLSELGSVYG